MSKEYGIDIDDVHNDPIIVDIQDRNKLYKALVNDNKELFESFMRRYSPELNELARSPFYPDLKEGYFIRLKPYSLLELCCYHGAVNCFKACYEKFDRCITSQCLHFSFLSKNKYIMNECSKKVKPDAECMKFAIISHDIDLVAFLMNEYHIDINLMDCGEYQNLQAFILYFDRTKDINNCFIYSPCFFIKSICGYFLSHGANIKETNQNYKKITALHVAAIFNNYEIADFLISNKADVNAKDFHWSTPLHYAASNNSNETIKILISNGAKADEMDSKQLTPIDWALRNIRNNLSRNSQNENRNYQYQN
ncbi:hypothetical protein TVAG_276120 [Trichomonas vaginalis G3]|uniref:DUF3447 domain-containing protein n=1 Tax=Trichomonas vaginalis (strain ATCC PRA-98 / G3) TaxID=412133 RepID=A2ECP3_TRIV3|nr:integrin-mediated signaling pathway [Trichomonas vaginalis G3]EAY09539.1 hypothetical protein TVAG_276120 [Trichomonas vaginalis G3]KAI5533165.1 integrin-mediated signaling pathway [Trichomonas vaginalis G3]|eukprot:XP_001321762.1 hypothetical protein [Trichomonas vaginalis G3]